MSEHRTRSDAEQDASSSTNPTSSSTNPTPSSSISATTLAVSGSPYAPTQSSSRPSASPFLTNSPHIFRVPQSPQRTSVEGNPPKAAKVAIPRLKKSVEDVIGSSRPGGRHRVNHACEPCRQRKTKCSGERPVCKHCEDFKITCFYADGKRDRAKKQFGSMTEKLASYEKLLKDLSSRVGEQDASMITSLMEQDIAADSEDTTPEIDALQSIEPEGASDASHGESEVSAAVGSTGALDKAEEDFTANEQAISTGFMGKNSEITWMQKLRQENKYGSPERRNSLSEFRQRTGGATPLFEHQESGSSGTALSEFEEGFSVHDSSYHLDDYAITTLETVDAYELPTRNTAEHLFMAYMARVHPTFPIVGKAIFTTQFRRFLSGIRPGDKWLAILNLIFAISAKYAHLIQAEWRGDERDHLIYFSRARILSMNGETILQHPDLQQVQVAALMSFYLLCTSQLNRAWMMSGMAIRAATGLGLNMRNESSKIADHLKEIRYRVWWSLYVLEHHLGSMTGRATSISDHNSTAPLPVPYDEDRFQNQDVANLLGVEKQKLARNPNTNPHTPSATGSTPSSDRSRSTSNPQPEVSRSPSTQPFSDLAWAKNVTPNASLYFLHYVQLTRLVQDIFTKLYTPLSIQHTWAEVQRTISELDTHLEAWFSNLPTIFDFKRNKRDREFVELRLSLGFFYYSARMTINRPCLCRLDLKIPNQSPKSKQISRSSASKCVDSAQEMLGLIPDEPNATGLNSVGPWWKLLHYLVQAATVLILELAFRATHMPGEADNILDSSKKAVRWLHQMGEENPAARRAWHFSNNMLRQAAPKIGREIDDLPSHHPGHGSQSSQTALDPKMPTVTMQNQFSQQMPFMYNVPNPNMSNIFDQYLPYDQTIPDVQAQRYQLVSSAEMEFMTNAYHEQGQQSTEQPPSPGSGQNLQ